MAITTKEITFESEIEYSLIQNGGYIKGDPANFDRAYAVDSALLFRFLRESQPKEWEKLFSKHGDNAEANFLKRLNKELDEHGMLHLLRNGVVDAPAKFALCYFQPVSGMNTTDAENYGKNILSVTRQVHYSLRNENSLDVVLFVNGLPIITLELKNPYHRANGRTRQAAI
ncbi:hypothetical protein FACS1894171_0690 [Clostridia bacterium]|nr:hypothetical protein FACS1894171_0690 [Clostridia bacterium]